MFFGKTRFKDLAKQLEKVKLKKQKLTLILFLVSGTFFHKKNTTHQENNLSQVDSIIINNSVDKFTLKNLEV